MMRTALLLRRMRANGAPTSTAPAVIVLSFGGAGPRQHAEPAGTPAELAFYPRVCFASVQVAGCVTARWLGRPLLTHNDP
jgi:hypothetical protein